MTKLRMGARVFFYASCVSSCDEYRNSSHIKSLHPNSIHIQTQCCKTNFCNDDSANYKLNDTELDFKGF